MSHSTLRKTLAPVAVAGLLVAGVGAGNAASAHEPASAPVSHSSVHASEGSIVDVTDDNLQETIEASKDKPTIFLVTAPSWCGYCKELDPLIRKKNADDGGKWTLAIVDDDKVSKDTVNHFDVSGFPTMVPYKNGEESGERAEGLPEGGQEGVNEYVDSVMGG